MFKGQNAKICNLPHSLILERFLIYSKENSYKFLIIKKFMDKSWLNFPIKNLINYTSFKYIKFFV